MLRRRLRLDRLAVLAVLAVAVVAPTAAQAQQADFGLRFSQNVNGQIAIAANGNVSCDLALAGCLQAMYGVGPKLNNNDWVARFINVDGLSETFTSSSAELALPAGATVLHASLYWSGYYSSSSTARRSMKLRHANEQYTVVTAERFGASGSSDRLYGGVADVTAYVAEHGAGSYWGADIQTNVGSTDIHAGWALVVAYRDPAEPPRNLAIFDGFRRVDSGTTRVTVPVSGFITPPTGPVRTRLGVVGWEGDRTFRGDQLLLDGRQVSNALNPADNVFNSTITNDGVEVTSALPDYTNHLGVDADLFAVEGYLANGARSAEVTVTTSSETIAVSSIAFATELYAPDLATRKTVRDVNGGEVEAGDVLEYTVVTSNEGSDGAVDVQFDDPLPALTSYVAGSASVSPGGARLEDGALRGGLGAGATATQGGSLAVGQSATIRFRVRIAASAREGDRITNEVAVRGTAQTLGDRLRTDSNALSVVVGRKGSDSEGGPDVNPDPGPEPVPTADAVLGVSITPSRTRVPAGGRVVYTVRTLNASGVTAKRVVTCVPIPAGMAVVNRHGGSSRIRKGQVCWRRASLAPNASARYRLTLRVPVTVTTRIPVIPTDATARASNAARVANATRIAVPRPEPVTG
jgi:uncharacterized repeat protein (TIGR01451 family)